MSEVSFANCCCQFHTDQQLSRQDCALSPIYIYIWHMFTNIPTSVQGHRGGLGWGVGTPPPILGSENTKKHVLEVNWMVISGYLPV